MPPRLERRQQTGNLHFITFSCHGRNPYLATPRAASIFEHSLESIRHKYRFELLGYVVMPEHVHLLISEPPANPLSTVVGSLKRSVSKQLPESPFWLPRYYDFNVYTEAKRVEKLRYLHRNPVTRGLVLKPEDYPWSSFHTYAFHTQGPVQIGSKSGPNRVPHDQRAALSEAKSPRLSWGYSLHSPLVEHVIYIPQSPKLLLTQGPVQIASKSGAP